MDSACILVQRKCESRFHGELMDASLKILHQICRWPGAIHKSFQSRVEAEQWLALPRASKYLGTVIATLLSTRSHDTIFECVIQYVIGHESRNGEIPTCRDIEATANFSRKGLSSHSDTCTSFSEY